ncbi:serpin family protein [Streptomyces sp. CA-111067]|uniref:serpin family protein n=1 Tax=Streptomyces sp. CA-111067 TaxID=3240046 RepID=UPI003D95BF74
MPRTSPPQGPPRPPRIPAVPGLPGARRRVAARRPATASDPLAALDAGTVRAVNRLTVQWAPAATADGRGGDGGTAFSAVGLWPLLAFLAGGAGGPARDELAAALGVDADGAIARGRALLEALAAADGVSAALGVWTAAKVPLHRDWTERLPSTVPGRLTGDLATDRAELDAWAAANTGGLIERMPLDLTEAEMVLATALALETTWQQPFTTDWRRPRQGPWAGRELAGLFRSSSDLGDLRVAADTPAGRLTVLTVRGKNALDVHLLLAEPGVPPAAVLAAGTATLAGDHPAEPGDRLPDGPAGPGVTVSRVHSWDQQDQLYAETVAFTVSADHDLMTDPALFGLGTASDTSAGHFPGVSDFPLAVGEARQAITASFSAEGFRAAAVTATGLAAAGVPQQTAKMVSVCFDRPFGFLAVHRDTGLVLTAGWVTDPLSAPPGNGW